MPKKNATTSAHPERSSVFGNASRRTSSTGREYEKEYPRRFNTRVEVTFEDSSLRAGDCRMEYGVPAEDGPYSPRGTTTPPMDEAGMRAKFFDLACRRISRPQAESLLRDILESEPTP